MTGPSSRSTAITLRGAANVTTIRNTSCAATGNCVRIEPERGQSYMPNGVLIDGNWIEDYTTAILVDGKGTRGTVISGLTDHGSRTSAPVEARTNSNGDGFNLKRNDGTLVGKLALDSTGLKGELSLIDPAARRTVKMTSGVSTRVGLPAPQPRCPRNRPDTHLQHQRYQCPGAVLHSAMTARYEPALQLRGKRLGECDHPRPGRLRRLALILIQGILNGEHLRAHFGAKLGKHLSVIADVRLVADS
jgi:hypothetical protein